MPRISDNYLDCVIYLYHFKANAINGIKAGGTGFIVRVEASMTGATHHLYAVTNEHVIRGRDHELGAPVIRMNTPDGKTDVLPMTADDWTDHPGGDDLSVCPIALSPQFYNYRSIPTDLFVKDHTIRDYNIGIGDDVFLVGRFISHDGTQRNLPTARFGNIAMMPLEAIPRQGRPPQISYLVELRSLPGYSGSPVFVWRPEDGVNSTRGASMYTQAATGPWLLGIDWSHVANLVDLLDEWGRPLPKKQKFRTNSGMAGVVPVWKLQELLDTEKLVMQRKKAEEEELKNKQGQDFIEDAVKNTADFESALRKVSRRIKPSEPDPASKGTLG